MSNPRPSQAPGTFRLLTLGGLSLVDATATGIGEQRRRLALLALLASARERGLSRDRLIACLSPESDTKSARHSLHQLLYYVRQQTSADVFLGTDPLRLNPAVITSDHEDFHAALEQGDLTGAVALYRGPFLDAFHLDSIEFEEWAAAERSQVASRYTAALLRLATDAESNGDAAGAVDRWRQLATADPLSGRVALGFMRSLVAVGDAAGALRHAQRYETRVRSEIGVQGDVHVSAFAASLRSDVQSSASRAEADAVVVRHETAGVARGVVESTPADRPSAAAPRPRFRRRRLIAVTAIGIALVVSAWNVARDSEATSSVVASGHLAETDEVLVADIDAPAGDTLAARALTELLRTSMSSKAVRVVSRATIDQALGRMKLPARTRVDAAVAREVALRNGYEAIVTTDLAPVGSGFLLTGHVTTTGGSPLAAASESAVTADALIQAVGRLAKSLRTAVGDSLVSREGLPALELVSTQSLRALALYTQAQDESRTVGPQTARVLTLLRDALATDSTFAMAHRRLGMVLINFGETSEGIRELRAAERFGDRLSEVERLMTVSSLHGMLRQHDRAVKDAIDILRLEPGNSFARIQLGFQYMQSGQYDVLEKDHLARGPVRGTPYFWPNVLTYQGRGAEALDSGRAMYRLVEDSVGSRSLRSARGLMARFHAVQFAYDSATWYAEPSTPPDSGSPIVLAISQFARGQLAKAIATQQRRAVNADGDPPFSGFYATTESFTALALVVIADDRASASRRLDSVLADTSYLDKQPPDRHLRPILALALAGRAADARRELLIITRAADADVRAVRETELALAEGAVSLAERHTDDAIAAFRRASTTMTWGSNDTCRVCALPWLGRAYEQAGARDSAAAVYERYLTTGDPQRGLSDAAWRAVTLHRLGTLHTQLGDTTRAVKRLTEFVELWKDADRELQPAVARARRQLAALRR